MIAVELTFLPTPARLESRPAHRARLEELQLRGELLAAGPWADDSGALLVYTVDRAEVDAIMAEDPYFSVDGVTVASVRDWRPVVVAGASAQPAGSSVSDAPDAPDAS